MLVAAGKAAGWLSVEIGGRLQRIESLSPIGEIHVRRGVATHNLLYSGLPIAAS